MKAPSDARPTWRNGVIQIHITRACDLSCIGCTQGSNLAGKPVIMTLDNFEVAVSSLRGYNGVIGIFGGNPTMHPKFEEICNILSKYIPIGQRGLWSNNLNGYGSLCRAIFNPSVSNLNVHTNQHFYDEMKRDWPECNPIGLEYDSRHSPPFVAMKDIEDLTDEVRWRMITSCDINQLWSAMVCQFRGEVRGFFCELAGAQSMLHEHEFSYPDTGINVKRDPNWWKYPIETYRNQIEKHCMECGIPLRGRGDLAVTGKNEYVSKTHAKIYYLKKPVGKETHRVENRKELGGYVGRATDYIANGVPHMDQKQILIGIPTAENLRDARFIDGFLMLQKPENTVQAFCHGQSPARNRNMIIRQALKVGNISHILFIDDDVVPPPDGLQRLLKHDLDVVSGLYLMRNFPHKAIMFDWSDDNGRCRWMFPPKESGLVEIVNCGLGFCLIKLEVFQKMIDAGVTVPNYGMSEDGKSNTIEHCWVTLGSQDPDHWCDDIGFFQRVKKAGIKIHCDLDVKCSHIASVVLTPFVKDGVWHTSYNTNGEGNVEFPMPQYVPLDPPPVEETKILYQV